MLSAVCCPASQADNSRALTAAYINLLLVDVDNFDKGFMTAAVITTWVSDMLCMELTLKEKRTNP